MSAVDIGLKSMCTSEIGSTTIFVKGIANIKLRYADPIGPNACTELVT